MDLLIDIDLKDAQHFKKKSSDELKRYMLDFLSSRIINSLVYWTMVIESDNITFWLSTLSKV